MDIYYDNVNSKLRLGSHGRGLWESSLLSTGNEYQYVWTGAQDVNWHDVNNWLNLEVPPSGADIFILNDCQHDPSIYLNNVACNTITIPQGMNLTIAGKILTVSDSLIIKGGLEMSGPGCEVEVDGNIIWKSGSSFSANTSTNNKIRIYGNWTFEGGFTAERIDSAEVYFMGSKFSRIYVKGLNCSFGNLTIMKDSGFDVIIDSESTHDLSISGDLEIFSVTALLHNSSQVLSVSGNIQAIGKLYFQQGSCRLKGLNSTIYVPSASSYFNDLEILALSTVFVPFSCREITISQCSTTHEGSNVKV
jgi:cytoskeletal protein CcmA (bactofilin family)